MYDIRYRDNKQVVTELKKMMLDADIPQREVARRMGVLPQTLNSTFTKRSLSLGDIDRILSTMGYHLVFRFEPNDEQ